MFHEPSCSAAACACQSVCPVHLGSSVREMEISDVATTSTLISLARNISNTCEHIVSAEQGAGLGYCSRYQVRA